MASSRNNNTIGNYKTEMIQQDKTRMHVYYTGSVINQTTCYPGDGLLGCRNPNLALANDFIDIETDLLGIGSTNLVNQNAYPRAYNFSGWLASNTAASPGPQLNFCNLGISSASTYQFII